ncbi:polymorphic toxin-type HINT domain-containing protein [Umezawaea sp. Da 62-37]|uniref:polymorphic toxin-type HINT domain-containing protein n=1 Tax=Umezawaea sp. Da 62-37 TaxID=3075927 RepID=UPI0028F6FAB9|nr:LamG-like jellyroll fold domain-containing protein [Umezawaea sp. Da 62-37]WNV89007.1 LamG-like jellyroll fold domain-containing protein [Umezawaea sp. Da 62-37]
MEWAQREIAQAMAMAPDQRWDSADGEAHEVSDTPPNEAEAKSLQSKYPPIDGQKMIGAPANEVDVSKGPSTVRGFDQATSREDVDKRGEFDRTYRNTDGTLTTEFNREPVNYQDRDGTWRPIDPSIVEAGRDGWRNRADDVELRFSRQSTPDSTVTMRLDDEHELSYGLRGTAASTGVVEGNAITYPDVLPGADLRLESQAGAVKEIVVLDSPTSSHSWVFPLRLKGLTAQVIDGRVVLKDTEGLERAIIPRGFMTDSTVDPRSGEPATSHGVTYSIVDDAGKPALKVDLDSAWLKDPARKYPVLVDPTVQQKNSNSSMFVENAARVDGASDLKTGFSGGSKAATYLAFDNIENELRNHKIFGAQLYLTNYWSWSCQPRPITVHAVTQAWGVSGGFPGPSVGPALAEASFAHGFIAAGQTSSSCPTASEVIDLGVGGRDLVQRWVTGAQDNYGLSVRASETDAFGWKKFTGHGTANPPKLFVTHTPYDAEYRIDRGVPEPPVHSQQGGDVKITVTNRGSQTWTPSTFSLGYRAYKGQGSPYGVNEDSAQLPHDVPRGDSVTLDAHINALTPGDYMLDFSMVHKGVTFFTDEQIPPARISFQVQNLRPIIKKQYPPNGYSAQTLTPQFWVDAVDIDSPPDLKPQYRFEICENYVDNVGVNCFGSGYVSDRTWMVPAGVLRWSKDYQWRAFGFDGQLESEALPPSHLLTAVPQPEITSHLSNAPYSGVSKAFDPQTGNYFASAIDATVTVSGPSLNVVRTYNSLDPRRDLAFGAGWSTRYDMSVMPDGDGSGNVVVVYPDGQQVRFGLNPDGSFAPPPGRAANFRSEVPEAGGGWVLVDKSFTIYRFRPDGKLSKILDEAGQEVAIEYDTQGHVQRAVSIRSGRGLNFTWNGAHVATVKTDVIDGTQFTWTYTYVGDRLEKVCDPRNGCAQYGYGQGSHYRSVVADSRPGSYYRLGEVSGTTAESQIRTNLGKDNGTAKDVALSVGAINGTGDGAKTFNGTSSVITLPDGTMRKNRDLAIEMWFKTTNGGPLFGNQKAPIDQTSAGAVPTLYVGQDGKLRGQFWNGGAHPITSTTSVNDNQWHHVVLSGSLATQTLFLDGNVVGTQAGEIDHDDVLYNQIGAAYTVPPQAWPGWGTQARRFFDGQIDEVAYYEHPLGLTAVKSHFQARSPSDQLTKLTLPTGRVSAQMIYDDVFDRLREYTDDNGGTWKLAVPAVTGNEQNLVRTTRVTDPGNRYHFYDFDPQRGRILRYSAPLGQGLRDEDVRDPSGQPSPPTPACPTTTSPEGPIVCGGPAQPGGGWIGGPAKGQGSRTFDYDAQGFQNTITDENGNQVVLTNDVRGNLISKKTCRVASSNCQTSYSGYYPNTSDITDPANDKLTESRDPRSTSATDNRFLTRYEYSTSGKRGLLLKQTLPDNSTVVHTYTLPSNATPAVGDGSAPEGLVATTTGPGTAVVKYQYYRNGDLARVTNAAGLISEFTYDVLGRKSSEKQISTAFPAGLTTLYTYDELSRTKTITNPATTNAVTGVKHTLRSTTDYDTDGRATVVTLADLTGGDATRSSTMGYDDCGRVGSVKDAAGNETFYGYDVFGNRTWMVDAGGNKYEYGYTARNKVAEVRLRSWHGDPVQPGSGGGDGEGPKQPGETLIVQAFAYDMAGRITRSVDAMGRKLRYDYFTDDMLRTVTAKDLHDPADSTKPVRDLVLESFEYDQAGRPVKHTTPGNRVQTTEYDSVGRVKATMADPTGLARRSAYDYDVMGNVTKVTQTGLSSNSVGMDVAGKSVILDFGYDAAGRRTSETIYNGADRYKTTYRVDDRGLVRSTTDARGNLTGVAPEPFTTDFGYDEMGRSTSTTGASVHVESAGSTATPLRPTASIGLDSFGMVTHTKDPNGRIATTVRDLLGRPQRVESPDYTKPGEATAGKAVLRYEYDAMGNVRKTTDPRGAVTEYRYDQLQHLVRQLLSDPDNPLVTKDVKQFGYTRTGEPLSITDPTGGRVQYTYDDLGRRITSTSLEREPTPAAYTTTLSYNDSSDLTSVKTPVGEITAFGYDQLGQPTTTTAPSGVVSKTGYDFAGRQVRSSDGLNRTTYLAFDQAGRNTGTYQLGAQEQILRQTAAKYDAVGNLTEARNALNDTTTLTYDAGSRLTTQVEPVADGHTITTSFGYDASGSRTRYTDGRGNATIFTTNSLGLPESVIEPSTPTHPAATDRTWTIGYDLAGNSTSDRAPGGVTRTRTFDGLNRLKSETGVGAEVATATRTLTYDAANRLKTFDAPGGTNAITYNDRGLVLGVTGPSGTTTTDYDGNGRPTKLTDASGTAIYTYNAGRVATVKDDITGATQTLGYNGADQVETVNYGNGSLRTYGYDDFGRPRTDTTKNSANAVVAGITYDYDVANQLKGKTTAGTAGAGANTYAYDRAGRLTSWTGGGTTTGYEWDDAGNRTKVGTKTSVYDARNRLTSDGDYTYSWSARGTMATRTSSGLVEQYGFDAFDRAVKHDSTTYAYDGLDRMVTRDGFVFSYRGTGLDLASDGTTTFGRGPGGDLVSLGKGTEKRLAVTDNHGDVVGAFDPSATVTALTSSAAYDPFGKSVASSGTKSPLGFQSDWTDPDTGEVDMGARWYDPGTGGFTARDNISLPSSPSMRTNRYTYGGGAPLVNTDINGHEYFDCQIANHGYVSCKGGPGRGGVCDPRFHQGCAVQPPDKNVQLSLIGDFWSTFGNFLDNLGRIGFGPPQIPLSGGVVPGGNGQNSPGQGKTTDQARDDAAHVAKNNPLPTLPAAVQPLFAGPTGSTFDSPVSSTPQAPAGHPGSSEIVDQQPGYDQEKQALVGDEPIVRSVDTPGLSGLESSGSGKGFWDSVSDFADDPFGSIGRAFDNLTVGDIGHTALDVLGMVPGFGEIADGVNALWYLAEGDYLNAGLSAAGMIPFLGWGATAGKAVNKGRKVTDDLASVCKATNSFTGDTEVVMADRSRRQIKDLRVGDAVWATDPTTHESGPREVTEVRNATEQKKLVAVTVDVDGDTGDRTGTVKATSGHPFWSESQGRWLEAHKLGSDSRLLSDSGAVLPVLDTRSWPEVRTVYNLTVDGLHAYYVLAGAVPVLVHNCGTGSISNSRPDDLGLEMMEADFAGVSPIIAGSSNFSQAASEGGNFLWTVGEAGNLNMVRSAPGIHHTVASGGKPVIGAGQVTFRNGGAITSFDNFTGHYTPPCVQCAAAFIAQGVDAFAGVGIRVPLAVIRDYGGRAP